MQRLFSCLCFVTVLYSCNPSESNRFSDPLLQQIADFQDRRATDSLMIFLQHESPVYRAAASLAFGSVQDTLASTKLGDLLLEDLNFEVRRNAAFALGQTGGFVAINSLIPATADENSLVIREVLEALGKTIETKDIHVLHEINSNDSLVLEGLACAYYRLMIRNKADSISIGRVTTWMDSSYPLSARKPATQFFARARKLGNFDHEPLITAALNDKSPEVRMAAARGLRHLSELDGIEIVNKILAEEKDYRVKCNAIRALGSFDFEKTRDILLKSLDDPDLNVAISGSEIIQGTLKQFDASVYEKAKQVSNWRVSANLFRSILSNTKDSLITNSVISSYKKSNNEYEKAWLMSALGESEFAFEFIRDELFKGHPLVLQTATITALVSLNMKPAFRERQKDFLPIYKKAIQNGDLAMIATVASALSDSTLGYKRIIEDIGFLKDARSKLALPEDIETIRPLERAIAYFEGVPYTSEAENDYNHPIPWDLIKTISSDQQVVVKTSKGEIVLQLLVNEAPGSVANFVELISKNYFDGKHVHRVVPNFVIQAGCKRGDGLRSEDYSLRSEFTLRRYVEGSVGMASAGKDTEGTQWFITHSATPHLDGGYTIFATVTSGMDVVHQLEVGDTIVSMTLLD